MKHAGEQGVVLPARLGVNSIISFSCFKFPFASEHILLFISTVMLMRRPSCTYGACLQHVFADCLVVEWFGG